MPPKTKGAAAEGTENTENQTPDTEVSPTVAEAPVEPTLVQLRKPFEMALPGNPARPKFEVGQVVSSQHYDLDLMVKQGAQLDVVVYDAETGKYEVVADLNSL